MNYSDQILENKAFNFFKQLMYNLALAICIMLLGVLVLVYGFKFQLYEVLSDSQAPVFTTGDMVVVKAQDSYEVGDILKYKLKTGTNVTHRLIYIREENNKTYYICHGDNVDSVNPAETEYAPAWEQESAFVKSYFEGGGSINVLLDSSVRDKPLDNIDIIQSSSIQGIVVAHIGNYGTYFGFIKEHYMLFIALVAGIWCISSVVQNELEIKRGLRLL